MTQRHGTTYFQETLARGIAFEQGEALATLHKVFPDRFIMNNQIDPSETTGGQVIGPRLYKGENRDKAIIAPDFVMFDNKGRASWIDAKLKKSSYSFKGRRYFSVDKTKHEKYKTFPNWMRDNFYFLFKNEESGKLHLAKFRDDPATVYFNNQYDRGEVPIYYLDDITELQIPEDK